MQGRLYLFREIIFKYKHTNFMQKDSKSTTFGFSVNIYINGAKD